MVHPGPVRTQYEVIPMSMGVRLAQARRCQNLTQEQLAEKLGVTRQAVSRWESDTAYPETDKIVRMAALFGVSCDYLLGVGELPAGDKPPSPVTRLLQEAAGKRVLLSFYEEDDYVPCDWAEIQGFDGGWANVAFVRKKKDKRDERLIPLSAVRMVTILPEGGEN